MKRIFSFLMALALLLSLTQGLPVHVHGQEHEKAVSETGEGTEVLFEKWQDAVDYMRKMLEQRATDLFLKFHIEKYGSNFVETLYDRAVDTSLRWTAIPVNCDVKIDAGYVYMHYSFVYLTTVQEEAELEAAADALLAQLSYDPKDTYDIVKKVYDWVCANVTYVSNENASLKDFTAYGALINRTATSHGFALLIHKLLSKAGLFNYVVGGTSFGQEHLWNIAVMKRGGEKYYFLDAALDAGKTEYHWFLRGTARFPDHTSALEYEDNVNRVSKEDFDPNYDPYAGHTHSWQTGTCLEPNYCNLCGFKSEEYGPHDFGNEKLDCERARFCYTCQQLLPPQPHTYADDRTSKCSLCDHSRSILCVGETSTVYFTDMQSDEQPQITGLDGLPITLLDDYKAADGSHVWTYRLSFTKIGSYRVRTEFASGQEPNQLDVVVYDHAFNSESGKCEYCDEVNETMHLHNWKAPDCNTPKTCTECGETEGEPSPHFFNTFDCLNKPSACIYCGQLEGFPLGHRYTSPDSKYCKWCHQPVVYGCTEGGALYGITFGTTEDYSLVNTDPRVSFEPYDGKIGNSSYSAKFELKASEPGTYEVNLARRDMDLTETVTLVVSEHVCQDGICNLCGKTDGTRHFHNWKAATCTEPKTCIECGETYGYPKGHKVQSGSCSDAKTCTVCQSVVGPPSHYYNDVSGDKCVFCKRKLYVTCQDVGVPLLLSSPEGGDFTLKDANAECSLAILEYFARNEAHYWECVIYTPGPGVYEIDLKQKGSEETLLLTVQVLPHMFADGICLLCGSPEGEHIHTWKSATCKKAAVCTECGQTEGERLNHDYGGYECCESAKCNRCGESRSRIRHTYDDDWDDYCNLCNKRRYSYCKTGTSYFQLENRERDGYYLKNAPRGVTLERTYVSGSEDWYRHQYKLIVDNPDAGVYEIVVADYGGEYDYEFTLEIFKHEFVDNVCTRCGKREVPTHYHEWVNATCEKPKYCKTCGETEGQPNGHDWQEATCSYPKFCNNCREKVEGLAPHDFVGWSCTQPGVCRNCNELQDQAFGHIYDGDLDEFCNSCGQFRLIGCKDQPLKMTFTSDTDTPYALVNPGQGISMTLDGCVQAGEEYLHTYLVSVPGMGAYELTVAQAGNSALTAFSVQTFDHRYEDGFCLRCGGEFAGLMGDVDGDGKLSYKDALKVLRASIKLETLTEEQKALADIDGNGKIDYKDALKILRASIGLE